MPDSEIPFRIRKEILTSDALIIIATPRTFDTISRTFKTLEWIHGETGIAYGYDKPLLILRDTRVSLEGLPQYLAKISPELIIDIEPGKALEWMIDLSMLMPSFRKSIEERNNRALLHNLGSALVGILAIVGSAVVIKEFAGLMTPTRTFKRVSRY